MTTHDTCATHARMPLFLGIAALLFTLTGAEAPALAAGHAAPEATISVAQNVGEDPEYAFITGRYELIQAANLGDTHALQQGLALIASAAEQGYAPAARYAGSLFLDGGMVPRDTGKALQWLQRAARLGDPESQSMLANLFATGAFGAPNPVQAANWYETLLANPAADSFPTVKWQAADRLAGLYADSESPAYQPERARALWREAATEGAYPPALEELARAAEHGIGGPAEPGDALRLYYDAAMAYHGGSVRYGIAPDTYRQAENEILAAMEAINPRHKLTHRLRKHIEKER